MKAARTCPRRPCLCVATGHCPSARALNSKAATYIPTSTSLEQQLADMGDCHAPISQTPAACNLLDKDSDFPAALPHSAHWRNERLLAKQSHGQAKTSRWKVGSIHSHPSSVKSHSKGAPENLDITPDITPT